MMVSLELEFSFGTTSMTWDLLHLKIWNSTFFVSQPISKRVIKTLAFSKKNCQNHCIIPSYWQRKAVLGSILLWLPPQSKDTCTLSKISNWSPYIFMFVLKVRFGYTKFMLLYINQCLAEILFVLTAVIKDQTPLFCDIIAWWQTLPAAKSVKISFLHAVYIGSSHCSVRLIIFDTVLKFSVMMYYY